MSEVGRTRARLKPDERRKQLIGIGLQMLVDRPIQELSLDAVAQSAGISRGLLFHYFDTKTDYYDAVIGAALRRVLLNVSPDADADPDTALRQIIERYYAQIERRREFYLALVFGRGPISLGGDGVNSHRMELARRVAQSLGLPETNVSVIHAWTAYVEDRALQWSAQPSTVDLRDEVEHCARALGQLLTL